MERMVDASESAAPSSLVQEKSIPPSSQTNQQAATVNRTDDNLAPPSRFQIIALGDSLTAGYGLPLAESYPYLLEQYLRREGFEEVEIINAGVSGETTSGTLSRLSFIRSHSPEMVILGIGGNDMLRFTPIATIEENLRAIIAGLTAPPNAPQLLLLQIHSTMNAGEEAQEEFDALYPSLAKEFDLTLIPFVLPEVFLNPRMMLGDGVHPNYEGYHHLVTHYIGPAVSKALSSRPSCF